MPSDSIEQNISRIEAYADKTTGKINAALIVLLLISGIHVFSWAIYLANRVAFVTLIINALGLVIVSSFFWHLANKPQFLVLSINETVSKKVRSHWTHRADTTKYALYGLLALCSSFVTYMTVFLVWAVIVQGGSLVMPDFFWATVILTLFFLSLIVCFLLGYQASVDVAPIYSSVEEPLLRKIVTGGLGLLPIRVASGSSHNIRLQFTFSATCGHHDTEAESVEAAAEYVEAEVQAAALKVDGEKRLRLCDTSPLPATTWNCQFLESGAHTLNLIVSEIYSATETRNVVFAFEHKFKVKGAVMTSVQPVVAITLSLVTLWISVTSVLSGALHLIM